MIGGSIVIPRGASAVLQAVKVEQSGKMKGSDKISLKLNSIALRRMVYEVATAYVETKGKGEGKRPRARSAAAPGLGAIVGGIAGGGSGAAIGAAVGGVTGAAVAPGRRRAPEACRPKRACSFSSRAASIQSNPVFSTGTAERRPDRTISDRLGRLSPSLAIRVSSVVGWRPSRSAAPPAANAPAVLSSTPRMWSFSTSTSFALRLRGRADAVGHRDRQPRAVATIIARSTTLRSSRMLPGHG